MICLLVIISFSNSATLDPGTVRNIQALSLSMFFSVLSCFAHWAFHWQDYFFADEYTARVSLKNACLKDDAINDIIKELTEAGFFGPVMCAIEGQARIEGE